MRKRFNLLSENIKAYILVFGAVCSFASYYISADYVFRTWETIHPFNAAFWGFTGAILLGSLFFMHPKKVKKLKVEALTHYKLLAYIVFWTVIGAGLSWWVVSNSNGGIAALLGKSEVLFTVLIGVFVFKENLHFREILAFIIVLVGLGVTASIQSEIAWGTVAVLLFTRFCYAMQSGILKRYNQQSDPLSLAFLRAISIFLIYGVILGSLGIIETIPVLAFIILGGNQFFALFLGRAMYFQAHKTLPISKLNFILILEPVLVLIGGFLLFGDGISSQKIFGASLILGGLFFFMREQFKLQKIKNEIT